MPLVQGNPFYIFWSNHLLHSNKKVLRTVLYLESAMWELQHEYAVCGEVVILIRMRTLVTYVQHACTLS